MSSDPVSLFEEVCSTRAVYILVFPMSAALPTTHPASQLQSTAVAVACFARPFLLSAQRSHAPHRTAPHNAPPPQPRKDREEEGISLLDRPTRLTRIESNRSTQY